MDNILTKYRSFWVCLTLTLATTAVFYQVCTYDFVNYDDPEYVYSNPNIQAGITPKTIKWAFTTGYAVNWHPLTWLTLMVDWQLFGSWSGGYHLTNLVFHIANTLLLFIVLKQMTQRLWPSAFVAALFALHPLHVESVAWVAERKDVLSTFFWMFTMWAYVRFVNHPKITHYLLVVVFLVLGLMSKPMLVTLPFVFLFLDYWPLDRLSPKCGKAGSKYSLSYLLIEKVPLFAMTLASCIVTFVFQQKGEAIKECGLSIRLANASISYLQYAIKTVWPARLAVFYPHPVQNISSLYAIISAILLLTVTILVFRFAANRRYLVTGWLWYLVTLVPVIGLVQVGNQALADRYTYIPLTGLFIIIAWGLSDLLAKWRYKEITLTLSAMLVISVMSICTHFQLRYWRNSLTLFQHALDVTENNYEMHFCIAGPLCEQGKLNEAVYHYSEAIRIRPDYHAALNGLGVALYKAGRVDEAIGYYKRALELNPNSAEANSNLGLGLASKGRFADAVLYYRVSLTTMDEISTRISLGDALVGLGRFQEAVTEYEKVLRIQSQNAGVHNNLGVALSQQGKLDEAIVHFNQAVRIDPNHTNARNNLNRALAEKQKLQNKNVEDTEK